jgi:alpha-tubulin suppressor-like RCC1 family protein
MNISNLQILLQEAIDNATRTVDYLLLAKAIKSLRMGQVRVVATYADLPTASTNEGLLIFVEADERLYWSTGDDWYNLIDENRGLALAWGSNESGQLGDNTITNRSSPVSIAGGFTDWCAVSTFCAHSLGVRSNGTLWAWGCNTNGQLGDVSSTDRSSPVSVVGGFTDWCAVSTGNAHSLGVRSNGTLWAWGAGGQGRLGDDAITDRCSPVSVVGDFTDWCAASAGSSHSLGVRSNGTLWVWGNNGNGRLGDDTITSRRSPVSVVGDFTDWCAASAGGVHSLGVRSNGSLWAWGGNTSGQLGDDTITDRSSPVSVVGGFTDWCAASAGSSHNLGVRQDGTLWAWGNNACGRLGDGTDTAKSSPVSVVGGFTDWCAASAGIAHSLGVRTNGSLWAWGINTCGRLGDGTITSRLSPVSVVGGFADWCAASAGESHSLALRKTDFVS